MAKEFKDFSKEERDKLAASGAALADGSFPIVTEADLKNAIHAFGRASNKTAAKQHIIKRARALGKTDLLPADWEGSTKKAGDQFREFTKEERDKLAASGAALADGSFPIVSVQDLKNALRSLGRASNRAAAKRHITKRARALGRTDLLPADWEGSTKEAQEPGPTDVHVDSPPQARRKPGTAFLSKLYNKLKEKKADLSEEDFNMAVRHARGHAGGMAKAAKNKSASEESLTQFISRVQSELYEAFMTLSGQSWFSYAKEVFADHVIACSQMDGEDYQIPFTVGPDGDIEFGEPFEVDVEYVPAQAESEEPAMAAHELLDFCAHNRPTRLFMEQDFAEPPAWVNYLPRPGEYTHPSYGKILITEERNRQFVDQFNQGVYQTLNGEPHIPIDAEHESKLSGACGWITLMRVNEDGSVDAKADWTDRGRALIESDRFKFFSPEWYDLWVDPADGTSYANIAIGGAITERPFFKEKALRPLVANEQGLFALDTPDFENIKEKSVVILNFAAMAPTQLKGVKNMPDETKPEAEETEASTEARQFVEMQSKLAAAETALQASEAKVSASEQRIAALEKASRAKRFAEISAEWPGDKGKHADMLEFLSTSDEKGEESDRFKNYVQQQDAVSEQLKRSSIFDEIGSSLPAEGTAESELQAKATALRQANPKLTAEQAFSEACAQNKDAYDRYRQEQRTVN